MPLFRLTDGTPIAVRRIKPEDKRLYAANRHRFSDKTMQLRFLAPKPMFSKSELRYLTEVDGVDHVAFIAVLADAPHKMVGVARWVRLHDDRSTAEAAIAVADELQGKGLGKRLADILGYAARDHGVSRIQATMASENGAAHQLMQRIGARLEDHGHDRGTHEVVASLAA